MGHFCAPKVASISMVTGDIQILQVVPERRIFDSDQDRWSSCGLHFKHTDNINHFLTGAAQAVCLVSS